MALRTAAHNLRALRAGFISFMLLGHMVLCSVAWVPEYIDRLGVSFAAWGVILGFAPLGAISAIVLAPNLINRFGVAPVLRTSAVLAIGFLVPLGFTNSVLLWTGLNTTFNFCASLTGVAVNTHSVFLQKKVSKSILSSLHAGWSIGAVSAAGTGAIATLFISLETYLIAVGILTFIGFEVVSRFLLSPSEDGHHEEKTSSPRQNVRTLPPRLWLLGFGLFCAVMPEIAVFEWSTVLARESGVDIAFRALPFTTFMVGMIAGRLSISRLARRFDVHDISVFGAALALVTMAAGVIGVHILGSVSAQVAIIWMAAFWLLAGLGLAPLGPTMISAASTLPAVMTTQAVSVLSFVAQSISILAKILMGAVAQGFTVTLAFAIPLGLLALGAVIAHRTSGRTQIEDLERANPVTGPLPIVVAQSEGEESASPIQV